MHPLRHRSVVALAFVALTLASGACAVPAPALSPGSGPPDVVEGPSVSTSVDAGQPPTTTASTTTTESTTTTTTESTTTPTSTTTAPSTMTVPDSPPTPVVAASAGSPDVAALQMGAPLLIDVGHVDLIEARVNAGRLELAVKDDSRPGGAVFRNPADVQVRVKDRSRVSVPNNPAFGFLGAAGTQVYLLPQVQDPNLVWPGWSTERISAGQLVGDAIRMRVTRVEGPGKLVVYTTDQFGSPSVLVDSGDGLPDQITIPIRTHAHANWAFSAPGVFRVGVEVNATLVGGAASTASGEYVFVVGDLTAPPTTRPGTTVSTAPPTTRPGTTAAPSTTRPATSSSNPGSSNPGSSNPGPPSAGPTTAAGTGSGGSASVAGRTTTRADAAGRTSAQSPTGVDGASPLGTTASLPNTGSTVLPTALLGGLAMILGAGLLWWTRRRSTTR